MARNEGGVLCLGTQQLLRHLGHWGKWVRNSLLVAQHAHSVGPHTQRTQQRPCQLFRMLFVNPGPLSCVKVDVNVDPWLPQAEQFT